MASREAYVTLEETEKNLTQRRKGAKVKTHAIVAQGTRTSENVTILNEHAYLWFVLSSLTNRRPSLR
jgi:hypothetical protein